MIVPIIYNKIIFFSLSIFQAEIELEMRYYGDILQLSIDDGYQHVPYKTLSGYAWTWLNFKDNPYLQWIIKLDDDLDLKMDKIINKLPISMNQTSLSSHKQTESDIYCPCIMRKM